MQTAGTSANSGRNSLTHLVQQIGDILAQGEDSGTPSQHTELRTKLRSALLRLLDVGVTSQVQLSSSRELAAVLQLLKLTLEKVPQWLSGDSNSLLLEILEKLLPVLARPLGGSTWNDLVDAIGRTVLRIAESEHQQFISLMETLCGLFTDAYSAAIALSLDPTNYATVRCTVASIHGADSGHRPIQLSLSSQRSCEQLLQATLKSISEAMAPRPQLSSLFLPTSVLKSACCLLSSSSVALQAAAMQLVTATIKARCQVPLVLVRLPGSLRLLINAAPGNLTACGDVGDINEFSWRLTALLHTLADTISSSTCTGGSGGSRGEAQVVVQLALSAATFVGSPTDRGRLLDLVVQLVSRDFHLLERNTNMLSMLSQCPLSTRKALLEATYLYFSKFDPGQIQQALELNVHAADPAQQQHQQGLRQEYNVQAGDGNGGGAPSSAKRRRVIARTESEEIEPAAAMDLQTMVPPGLAAVTGAVCAAVYSLKAIAVSTMTTAAATARTSTAVDTLGDLCHFLAPVFPTFIATIATDTVKAWSGWGALQFGGRGVSEEQLQGGLKLLASGMEATVYSSLSSSCATASGQHSTSETSSNSHESLIASYEGISTALLECVRGESAGAAQALVAAVLGAHLGVKDFKRMNGVFSDIFEAARGKETKTQVTRAALLPAAAYLAAASTNAGSGVMKKGKSNKQQQSAVAPLAINPVKGLLLRMSKSQDPEVIAALIRSLHIMAVLATTKSTALPGATLLSTSTAAGAAPTACSEIALHIVNAALSTQTVLSYNGSYSMGNTATSTREHLTPAVCDWLRPVLDNLCSNDTAAVLLASSESGTYLVDIVSIYLECAPVSDVEQSKCVAQWLITQSGSTDAAVRAAVLRQAPLLATPQLLLTLHYDGAHPLHARERRSAADKIEQEVIVALKTQLQGATENASKAEDIIQLVGHVGWSMRSSTARMLTLAILVFALEQKDVGVSATAAECLRGIATANKCSIKELIFSTPRLVEHVGRQLPHKSDLLHELADLINLSPKALALAVLPRVLPQFCAKRDGVALECLAEQGGISVQRMLLDHGHHALAASLMHGSPGMDDLIPLTEEMTGQDFILLARAILPRTVTEMVAQTGAAHEWDSNSSSGGGSNNNALAGSGGGGLPGHPFAHASSSVSSNEGAMLPELAVLHTSKMLALLASTTAGGSSENENMKINASEFLAEGDHVTRMLKEFGDELERRLAAQAQIVGAASAAGGLQEGSNHHKQINYGEIQSTLNVLRRIIVLVRLTGPYVGRFLPQFMVLLGAAVRPGNHREIKLQGLVGWQLLVKFLSTEAPVQLGGIVNQVVVTLLEGLQEGGHVGAAAARVIEELITACRSHFPAKIRSMPPLPQRLLELRHINTMLQEARGSLTTHQHVELLLESLGDEALSVRSTALQELREVLSSQRTWLIHLRNDALSDHSLEMRLLSALLKSAEPGANSAASLAAQQACAECLGMLGAIDPSRVKLDPQDPAKRCSTEAQLAIDLVTKHLVRLLKTAPNLQTLDSTTLAIQEVLRSHASTEELRILNNHRLENAEAENVARKKGQGSGRKTPGKTAAAAQQPPHRHRSTTPQLGALESNLLFTLLPVEVQAIVRPYLDSKFSYRATGKKIQGVIFRQNAGQGLLYRRWLALWLTQLIDTHVSGDYLPLLQAIKPVLRHDIPTAMFIAPYCVQIAVCRGGRAALNDVTAEVLTVLQAEGSSRDSVLCMQAVFTLLDVLQRWYEEAKAAYSSSSYQNSSGSTAGTSDTSAVNASTAAFAASEWPKVSTFLTAIPKNTVARAAAACGAHARALLHYETHLRATRGHGANPVGTRALPSYGDGEVTFLLEIYSKLEEPDGLEGLMKLRQGGPRPEDQRLAAEKAGSWGEALSLYERDLARQEWPMGTGGGDGSTTGEAGTRAAEEFWNGSQRGYLNCLLQMGHWQGLLAQVEGMTSLLGDRSGSGNSSAAAEVEAPRLAAMGSAAAWRLGRWQQLDRYLENVETGFSALNPDERWEARIGLLLRTTAVKAKSRNGANSSSATSALAAELEAARAEVMGPFSAAAMESYSRAYSHLVKLHMLQEVADAAALMGSSPKERRRTLRWDDRLAVVQSSLTMQVPILALRRQLAALSGATDDVGKCWLQHAQLCRSTGHFDAAVPAVLEAAAVGVPGASLERVELLYAKGEQHRAISELHILDSQLAAGGGDAVNLTSEADKNRYRARVILRLAEWTVETGQGTHDDVTSLFENALTLRNNWETGLFKYACYLDELMQDARARQGASGSGSSAGAIDRLGGKSRIKLGEDRHHVTFLPEVLRNYGRSVQYGNRHIYRSLPRLLTLWFDFGALISSNPSTYAYDHRTVVASIKDMMENFAKSIPSHCWLISLPQLISRICHKNNEVAFIARHIVVQTIMQYPQQGLWQMAAVSKSGVQVRRSAASGILGNAKKAAKTEHERFIFAESGALCEQLIKLCHSTPASSRRVLSARKDLGLTTLTRTMPLRVMIPTMSSLTPALPPESIDRGSSADRGWRPFGDPVTIAALKDEIEIMSSLQKPKRIVLIGSDGREYPFLAKPKDDLRKDCRMMEASGVINRIFEEEPAARRRTLHIRRFAVVPITEDCGLVEWVPNTKPLRHCITSLAESSQAIKDMQNYAKSRHDRAHAKGKAALIVWLEDMVRSYPPTFHRWFLATWAEPAAWLNARLNYTRSYAVWCMVGHIAGLGDRHGENVLLDMQSGDAMQIDFGCLFDKGLTLALPEVVPFRLTPNVIDGFGVAGVEGVYRRSCETTLSVLRKHCDTILSVMDTFVHDPLVEWARDEKKLRNVAVSASGVAEAENPQAKDAMATIEGRLKGTLLGVSARPCMPLSVEGHVHRLIVEATAKENLSRMYIWWAPFQ